MTTFRAFFLNDEFKVEMLAFCTLISAKSLSVISTGMISNENDETSKDFAYGIDTNYFRFALFFLQGNRSLHKL